MGNDFTLKNSFVTNNQLSSNNKVRGGGIEIWSFNEIFSTVLIQNNIISGNTAINKTSLKAAEGGGISLLMGLPTNSDIKIRNNLIQDNELHGYEFATYAGAIQVVYFEPGGILLIINLHRRSAIISLRETWPILAEAAQSVYGPTGKII